MSAAPLDLESLLAPLQADAPSGPDLVYDEAFLALEQAGAGKPESQWGPAVPPDWNEVHELALGLSERTRDLRVAVWLTRARIRIRGLAGLTEGLSLLQSLVAQHWDSVHPMLDPDDGNDATMRMNALAALAAGDAGIADVRSMSLAPVRGSLSLRELELGLGRAEAGPDETQPTEAGVLQALQSIAADHTDVPAWAESARQSAHALDDALQSADSATAPDLGPLLKLLDMLADAVAGHQTQAETAEGAEADASGAGAGVVAVAGGPIRNRNDAAQAIDRISDWLERNEPSNPAPLLLRRARRLLDKSFLDIVRDLAPDGLQQVERIAGTEA